MSANNESSPQQGNASDGEAPVDEARAVPASNKKPKILTHACESAAAAAAAVATTTTTTTTAAAASGATVPELAETKTTVSSMGLTVDKPMNESYDITNIDQQCFMLGDTTETDIPPHLQRLMGFYNERTLTQAEAVFLLIYVVALENGYATQADYQRYGELLTPLSGISTYHMRNVYQLAKHKPTYNVSDDGVNFTIKLRQLTYVPEPAEAQSLEPAAAPVLNALLSAFVSGDLMLVTISPMAHQYKMIGYSCCVPIGRYVLLTYSKKKPYHQRFRLLGELAQRLRNQLFVPMRCQQLVTLGILPNPSLHCLPAELYEYILQYLKRNQRKIFLNVSKRIYYSCRDSKFIKSK